ncbi:MAG: hypothetical protein ACRBFS_08045, partial [Aureispira sp.]
MPGKNSKQIEKEKADQLAIATTPIPSHTPPTEPYIVPPEEVDAIKRVQDLEPPKVETTPAVVEQPNPPKEQPKPCQSKACKVYHDVI